MNFISILLLSLAAVCYSVCSIDYSTYSTGIDFKSSAVIERGTTLPLGSFVAFGRDVNLTVEATLDATLCGGGTASVSPLYVYWSESAVSVTGILFSTSKTTTFTKLYPARETSYVQANYFAAYTSTNGCQWKVAISSVVSSD